MVVSEIKKRPPLANESRMGLNQNDSQLKGQSAEMNGVVDSNSDDESDAGITEFLGYISQSKARCSEAKQALSGQ